MKSFKPETEKLDRKRPNLADAVIRSEFVREPNGWKIDDIEGSSDGEAWSTRGMLNDYLKN